MFKKLLLSLVLGVFSISGCANKEWEEVDRKWQEYYACVEGYIEGMDGFRSYESKAQAACDYLTP